MFKILCNVLEALRFIGFYKCILRGLVQRSFDSKVRAFQVLRSILRYGVIVFK